MKKIYLPLLKEQKNRKVYFSSTLSPFKFETSETTRHEITTEEYLKDYKKAEERESLLKGDNFFNISHFKYNIIRS